MSGSLRGRTERDVELASRSIYYAYAQQHIACECPLCRCPARDGEWYSFVYVREDAAFIYFDVPKCASTTVRYEFFDNDNTFSLLNPRRSLDSYLKFTFVRNPWDRLVSTWLMFTTEPRRQRQLRSMTTDDLSTFESFVHFARDVPNHHWQPQTSFLPEPLDFVGRLESFDDDFARLCSLMGRPYVRPEKRRAGPPRAPYWTHYSPVLVDVVGRMYAEDVEAFEYRCGDDP